ncbi:serine hydrolase domain-containing protein [Oceanicoccus sagamiensis]|uniref:serine hydrolase domain-containing protein n=1 Tax=Oceanicoccus sagamiensis TaxID=716816 RepID=UPI00146B86C6|nr:serine hydrolase domain-containing protein [Oceanicoccus sagamiensis]
MLLLCGYFSATASAIEQPAISTLLKQLDTIRKEQATPAYSLVITDSQQTLLSTVRGVELAGQPQPVNPSHWFRVGSITKSFVALASLIAEEKQLLALDKPIIDTLGPAYYQNPWSATQPLTLEQLLEQTSGLPDMSQAEWDHNIPIPLDTALKKFADQHTLQWPAGEFYSYSNTNYGLAGLVLEKSTRQSFDDFIAEEIFKPLGIVKASLSFQAPLQQNLITGYNRDGKTPFPIGIRFIDRWVSWLLRRMKWRNFCASF